MGYTESKTMKRTFVALWTGKEIDQSLDLNYVSTVQEQSGLVVHVFEVL